jgi:hypothetical protein
MSELQELSGIRQLMEEAARGVPDRGRHFVIWGVVMAAAVLATYAALPLGVVWGVALAAGWGLAIWTARRETARAPVDTLLARVLAGIWVGCGVSATLVALLAVYGGAFPAAAVPGAIALILGGGYFASSVAYRRRWMALVAGAWWLGGAAMLIWPARETLLVLAGLLVLFQIVPGVLLRRQG